MPFCPQGWSLRSAYASRYRSVYLKVAIVAGKSITPRMGGQGTFCAGLATGLLRLGHDVDLLVLDQPDWRHWVLTNAPTGRIAVRAPSPGSLAAADIVHVNTPWLRVLLLGVFLRRPMVVTHQDFTAVCPARTAWARAGKCTVANGDLGPCRHCPAQNWGPRTRLRLQAAILRRVANVAVSACLRDRLAISDSILSPLDADGMADLAEEATQPRAAYVGRLSPEKGVEIAIRALTELPSEVELDIYGDGPLRQGLEGEAAQLRLQERVHFHGHVSAPGLRARAAALFVVPSLWDEPFGYVTAECMAAGKAVIAAATGASPELLGLERGWLVPPGDPSALAGAIREVLASPDERVRRGRLARQFVLNRLTSLGVARSYEEVYRRVLGHHASGHRMTFGTSWMRGE